jgi:hypothetical protein
VKRSLANQAKRLSQLTALAKTRLRPSTGLDLTLL